MPVNFKNLEVDFAAFSAHKMCGPTGIGVLYGREELLSKMPPFLGGGDMIKKVELRSFKPNELPHKFEAGTPAIAEVIGFGAAVDFLAKIGMTIIAQHEQELIAYAVERLEEIQGVTVLGPEPARRGGVASFTLKGIHPHDVAQILDQDGIAVRAGHHCAMPLHDILGIPASTRASFYLYNTTRDVDALIEAIYKVKKVFHEE
jgi:cysteine desulfurase/selenocysteine lyase